MTPDGDTLIYTDAAGKRIGFLDITDPSSPAGLGTVSLSELGHADDQPTSVAAYGDYVLVVIDESGGNFVDPSGRVDVLRVADRTKVASFDLGGQPDSIAISKEQGKAVIAIENQRDEDLGDGGLPQAPAGFLSVVDLHDDDPANWAVSKIDLTSAAEEAGISYPEDLEPEYVSANSRGEIAVTLQENNGVLILDLRTNAITSAFDAGTVDLTGIDIKKDGVIDQTGSLSDVPREPDAVGWIGDEYLATANEGDWKGGSRGWTVFNRAGDVVWDAGSSFEEIAIRHGLHNNDRAGKKGPEPEGLAVSTINGVEYAFVASERSNFVAVYDVTTPSSPEFIQVLFTTNGPEGLLPIPERNLLAVSSETDDAEVGVRASVALFELGNQAPAQPSIISADVDGKPIGWTALGALSADPVTENVLYSATDAALKQSQLYRIDVSAKPAVITEAISVNHAGEPASYDVEGLFKRPQGGFWLASEGKTGPANLLVRTDDEGAVQEEIPLPEDISSHIGKWGLEGVTAITSETGQEQVFVAVQRPLWVDPAAKPLEPLAGENTALIGRYDVAAGTWTWFGYELETTATAGDWMGLSEIVAVDGNTLAVIERDKLNGPKAAVKRIYSVEIPATENIARAASTVIPLEKKLAYDALPDLQAPAGWTQEKLEGLTISAAGKVFAVTDNDGLEDATGETLFWELGDAAEIFAEDLPEPSSSPSATPSALPTQSPEPTSLPEPSTEPTVAPTNSAKPTNTAAASPAASVVPTLVPQPGLPSTGR